MQKKKKEASVQTRTLSQPDLGLGGVTCLRTGTVGSIAMYLPDWIRN